MLRARVADNTFALTCILCTWAFLIGHLATGPYKYGAFLATFILDALIFNQYSPVPGSTGTWNYYVSRISEYSIGVGIAWFVEAVSPWSVLVVPLLQTHKHASTQGSPARGEGGCVRAWEVSSLDVPQSDAAGYIMHGFSNFVDLLLCTRSAERAPAETLQTQKQQPDSSTLHTACVGDFLESNSWCRDALLHEMPRIVDQAVCLVGRS